MIALYGGINSVALLQWIQEPVVTQSILRGRERFHLWATMGSTQNTHRFVKIHIHFIFIEKGNILQFKHIVLKTDVNLHS